MIRSVTINDSLTLSNDSSSAIWLSMIDGIHEPPRRSTEVSYSDRSGGSVPKQLYGPRVIQLQGGIDGGSCASNSQNRSDFIEAMPLDVYVPIRFNMSDGRQLETSVKFTSVNMPISSIYNTDWNVIAVAKDYRLSDVSGVGGASVTLDQAIAGGWREYSSAGWREYSGDGWREYPSIGQVNAVNTGSYPAEQTIRIYGIVQNPVIYNYSTGELFKVNITTSSADDVILIDTAGKYTTLNGGNINALVDDSSTYFSLQPGDNLLQLVAESGDGYAVSTYYATYVGA